MFNSRGGLYIVLTAAIIISGNIYAEEPSVLTLEECVKDALANNPQIQQAMSKIDFGKAGVGLARSGYLPQATTTTGYSHADTSKITLGGAAGLSEAVGTKYGLAKRYNTLSESTGVEQLIWDFGKTLNQIKLANENLTTAQFAFLEAEENVILNTERCYFEVLKAQLLLDVAKENLAQSEVHLERAKGFYEVGFKQKYDVTKAELEVSNANLDHVTAKKNYDVAKAALNNIMGTSGDTDYKVSGRDDVRIIDVDLNEALKTAMVSRVEILRRQSETRAAQTDLEVKKKGNWPTVSASGTHQVSDTDVRGVGNVHNWNAGVAIKWPWFDGFRTRSEIEAAEANLKIAQSNIQDQTLSVVLEVRDAVLSLEEAKERINMTKVLLQQASENLEIAQARYEEGFGSIIEVTDAETSLVSAKRTHAAAISDYLISQANYEKSIGTISQSVVK